MTEKDKKAIKILKEYRFDFECEGKYPYLQDSITKVLNLIKKQQRELTARELDYTTIYIYGREEEKDKWKNKIKNKIQEIAKKDKEIGQKKSVISTCLMNCLYDLLEE